MQEQDSRRYKHMEMQSQTRSIEDIEDHTLVAYKTPVIPMEQASDPLDACRGSTASAGIQAIKSILDTMANKVCVTTTDDFPAEELSQIKSITSLDTEKTATEIVSMMEEGPDMGTEVTANGEPISQSKDTFWGKVLAKLKAFFVHIHVKESILKIVAKIIKLFDCTLSPKFQKPLSSLLEGVEYVVDGIIQKEEEETGSAKEICLYRKIADDISNPDVICNPIKQLAGIVYHHLSHDGTQPNLRQGIIIEVDMFTKMMWNWLNKQVQREQRKKDIANRAMRKIKRAAVDLLALPEPTAVMEGETLVPVGEVFTTDEPVVCSKADEETSDVYPATSPEDLFSAYGVEVVFTTDEPVVCSKADEETSDVLASPDDLKSQSYCILTAVALQIFKHELIPLEDVLDMIKSLTELFVTKIQESNITLKMERAQKIAKAVQKKLCKRMGNKQVVQICLLTKTTSIYEMVIETLLSCLEIKTNPFVRVFRSLCNIFRRSNVDQGSQ